MKSIWRFLIKWERVLPEEKCIPFLGMYAQVGPPLNRKTSRFMVIMTSFVIVEPGNKTDIPHGRMDTENFHLHHGISVRYKD